MAAEDPRDEDTSSYFLLEVPFDLEHAPVSLNCDGSEAFLLSLPFSFTIEQEAITIRINISVMIYEYPPNRPRSLES